MELDQQITRVLPSATPRRFAQAIALEYLSRCIFMFELLLIVASLGVRLGYARAFAIGGLEAILGNVMFFVPFELGAREGAFVALFSLFGMDPQLGLYASIVGRVRDFTWIGIGLALMLPAQDASLPYDDRHARPRDFARRQSAETHAEPMRCSPMSLASAWTSITRSRLRSTCDCRAAAKARLLLANVTAGTRGAAVDPFHCASSSARGFRCSSF